MLGLCLLLPVGCAWKIHPPAELEEPADVYVSRYGWHTRLALPMGDGSETGLIEYGFGDWKYYALEQRGVVSGIRALFFSDASALARRELSPEKARVFFLNSEANDDVARIAVERSLVIALREQLETRWASLDSEFTSRSDEDIVMAKVDDRYSLWRNSNTRLGDWLTELGCEVEGRPIWSNFRVRE